MKMDKNLVELRVSSHPSGRLTLVQNVNRGGESDLGGALVGNLDRGDFYRAVASKIAALAASDYRIVYRDTV